ncbi:nucleotide exchange factor GrpE [Candidatus Campbellbacteria bacterium RIFOXYC2_FULL_35_25]|uniref:Protein GrpE n=1 Tax=Candidatus Campbellbacteria bacterium RIFOXYC2_FULL_35_25 TaxID=1797582 RepID=A0A1F5EK04_9BACT|nr:MAG: nucleotide exchange factor GrpE [Candidatus Campbellbacteria bacterium RIFOXYC2_FULL_35_25]
MSKKQDKKEEKNEEDIVNDDITIEVDEENMKESSFGGDIKKIREKLKSCTEEKQEYLAGWQRAKADLINAKKDFEERRKDFVNFAKGDLIIQIIPVLDSFDMAFKNIEGVPEQWLKGVEYIYNQMISVLKDNGVEQIDPKGEKFDMRKHTSVEMIKVDEEEKDSIILEVIQKGYELNGKILKEAKVKVGEFEK